MVNLTPYHLSIVKELYNAAERLRYVPVSGTGLPDASGQPDPPPTAMQVADDVEYIYRIMIALDVQGDNQVGVVPQFVKSICRALQRVLAVSVRKPATLSANGFISQEDLTYSVITRHAMELSYLLMTGELCTSTDITCSAVVNDFALTLMRMHTLHCYSRQLAAITAVASEEVWPAAWTSAATRDAEGAAAGTRTAAEHTHHNDSLSEPGREYIAAVLYGGVHLLHALSGVGRTVPYNYGALPDAGSVDTATGTEQGDLPRRRATLCELAAALRDSCLVEHLAKAWLTLQCKPSESRPLRQQAEGGWMTCFRIGLSKLHQASLCCREEGMEAEAAALQGILSGRCLQCLVLAMGVATLRAADGGPVYGMPQKLLCCLAVPDHGDSWYDEVARCYVFGHVFNGVIQVLAAASNSTTCSPPLGRRSALALLLRIGRCAMASMLTWTRLQDAEALQASPSPSHTASAGGDSGDSAIQLPAGSPGRNWAMVTCVEALYLAVTWPGAAMTVLAEEEYWRLVAGTARELQAAGLTRGNLHLFAKLLQPPPGFEPGLQLGGPLPPSPPPWTAAALSGGLLPCLERLLRRAGEAQRGPEAVVVGALFRSMRQHPWPFLWPLLAYGEPRQAAALMATFGKLLRRLTPQLLVECSASSPMRNSLAADAEALGIIDLALPVSRALSEVLSYGVLWMVNTSSTGQSHEGDSRDSPAAAAAQQLGSVLMYGAYDWLPTLSKVLMVRLRLVEQHRWPADGVDIAVLICQACLVLLLRNEPVAAAVANSTPADVASAAVSDFTRMLAHEVGVVAQLGAALGAARELHGSGCWESMHLAKIVECCVSVAELFRSEVQMAVLQSAITREAAGTEGGRGAAGSSAGGNVSGSGRPAPGGHGTQTRRGDRGRGGSSTAASGSVPVADDGSAAAAAAGSSAGRGEANVYGWLPHNFRYLQEALQREEDCTMAASFAGEMAGLLEHWAAGVTHLAVRKCILYDFCFDVSLLVSARGLLRTCTHRGCTNLAGDSEAELRLRACDGCGAAWYCCRECQLAHWRAGHREQCGGRRRREADR